MGHTGKMGHTEKCVTLEKIDHTEKWVTLTKTGHTGKMGHTWKTGSHVEKCVTRQRMDHTRNNGSHLQKWVITWKNNSHTATRSKMGGT